jgi:tetrahydromethanopterin S-methyltransferase subunit G
MNHHHKKRPPHIVKHHAYRRAFQRLDEALERNSDFSNHEKIRLLRQAAFADVDAYEMPVLPKKPGVEPAQIQP